ncbi:DUF3592 domain-containing protein [Sulfurovum sp. NBC37-1]|uniref:DUF3592 domain-containing protein n=1 Tax=Sulfurovum sp. (strain NBC37-1) TaxID=387093 RepID=UPI000158782B|nr:DUF3592 domain-containing protein [Sulfurovum sp. NBC37-1]BAF71979.1 hypothetical protein SUN_1022 [Sulfurovum sp. NBC37-1]
MSRQKKASITHEIYKMCKQSRFVFFFMIVVPVFIGLYFFYIGVKEIKLANESTGWPSVQGKITISLLSKNISSYRRHPRGAPSIAFHYKYEIDQKIFIGDRVMYGYKNNFFTSDSYRQSKAYTKGNSVTVYYNPDNPEQAVLEPGANFPYSWNIIMIALILMIPLYFVIKYEFLYKDEKSEDEE